MKELIKDIVSFETFNPNESKDDYTLTRINDNTIEVVMNIFSQLLSLEESNQLDILFRGVIKDRGFKENDLSKHFIVGEKGKYYLNQEGKSLIYTENFNNRESLKIEVITIVKRINRIIKERNHILSGHLDIESFEESSIEDLRYFKLFYTAVLHNIGNRWSNKRESIFISTTYGDEKLKIAKGFATPSQGNEGIGLIFVYYKLRDTNNSIRTKHINEVLEKLQVKWYDDKHNELMVIDGIFPHYNLGILELLEDGKGNFIVNPWLYNQIQNDVPLNIQDGIYIDQTDFIKLADDLGYNKYYEEFTDGNRNYHTIDGKSLGITGTFK